MYRFVPRPSHTKYPNGTFRLTKNHHHKWYTLTDTSSLHARRVHVTVCLFVEILRRFKTSEV